MRYLRRSPGSPRRPGSGPPAESGGCEERCRVRDGTRSGPGRGHPGTATRGACGQNLHEERRGDLLSSPPVATPRRREARCADTRRSPARCEVLFPRLRLRCRIRLQGNLLRDTCSPRRAVDRCLGCGLTLRRLACCPYRSRARDPRGPPGGPVGSALTARGDACAELSGAGLRPSFGSSWVPAPGADLSVGTWGRAEALEAFVDASPTWRRLSR